MREGALVSHGEEEAPGRRDRSGRASSGWRSSEGVGGGGSKLGATGWRR
jgi:hypothetical protein